MAKCAVCGEQIPPGTGLMFVKKDGRIIYFDKKKCEKNLFKLKRNPAHLKWSKNYVKG